MQQHFIVQPNGTVTLALNQMRNVNITCECIIDLCQPYWILGTETKQIATNDNNDKNSFIERGITYESTGDSTTLIIIPDRVENNNTNIVCAAFLGNTEFSDETTLIIIGESE